MATSRARFRPARATSGSACPATANSVAEFVTAGAPTSDEPRYDLDMNAFGLVKSYRHGKGTTYPDMNWEPKQSFHAVAEFYAHHSTAS